MAKYGKSLAQVVIEINGKKQAEQVLKAMQSAAKDLEKSIAAAKSELEQLAQSGGGPEYDAKHKEIVGMQQELKQLNKAIGESKKFSQDIGSILDNMSANNVSTLNRTKRSLEALLSSIVPNTKKAQKQMEQLQKAIKQVTDEIARRKGQIVDLDKVMKDLGKATPKQLDDVEKRLQTLLDSVTKNSNAWRKYNKQMRLLQEERSKRTTAQAQDIMGGNYTKTIEGIQQAIKALEDYKKIINADSPEVNRINTTIEKLKQNIKETESGFLSFEDAMKKAQGVMSGSFDPTLDDLEQIQKVLKEGMQNKFHIANPEDEAQLKQTLGLMEEMLKKQKEVMRLNHQDKVDAVSGKLDKVSPAEIEEAVKAAKELQQVAKTKEEFIQLDEFIGKAEARLRDWNETSKQSVMKSQIKDLSAIRALSDSALQDQLKFWEGTMNAAKKTSTAYKEAKKNFEELQAESKRRLQFEGEKTINDVKLGVGDGSTKQMQERLKLLQDYRAVIDGTKPDAYKAVDEAILKLTEDIKASQAGFLSFDKALERAKQISEGTFKPTLEDLEQIQKALKEGMQSKFNLVDDADIDQLKETRRLMDEMAKKQAEADRIRLKDQATEIMGGDYTKTIEGTKQAIELLKKYQDTLDTTNPDAINEVTKSINKMKEELESASRAKAAEVMADPMKFSADEINEAIKLTEKLQAATNNATVWENYEQQLIKAREARDRFADDSKYRAMVKQFEDLEDLTANAWAEQKKYWEAMRDSGKYYDEAIEKLKEMQKLETTRMKDSSTKTLTTDLLTAGTGEIKQSVEWLTKYQASLEPLEEEWTDINNLIKAGEERLKSIAETVSKQNLSEQADKILGGDYTKTIEGTKQAIEILKKYQDTLDTTNPDAINEVTKSINKMKEELESASRAKAEEVMANPMNFSADEINEAIKLTEKLQAATNNATVWEDYEQQLIKAREARDRFADDSKYKAMVKQFEDLEHLTANAWAEQKKYWEAMRDSGKHYDEAIAKLKEMSNLEQKLLKEDANKVIGGDYTHTIDGTKQAIELLKKYQSTLDTTDTDAINAVTESIKKMSAELDDANRKNAKKVLVNPMGFSPAEIDEAIKMAEKMQNEVTGPNAKKQWNDLAVQIDNARKVRDEYVGGGKFEVMNKQFQDFDNLSKSAAAEQKKYWEGLADSMAQTDPRYQTVLDNIKKIKDAEKVQLESKAADIMGGTYDKTIEGTQQAIELLKKYQSTLDATDTDAINAVTESIKKMSAELDNANRKNAKKVLANPMGFSPAEIDEAIKTAEKMQSEVTGPNAKKQWNDLAVQIDNARKVRDEYVSGGKLEVMNKQFQDFDNLSKSAAAEQKKYWEGLADSMAHTDPRYQTVLDNIKKIKDTEQAQLESKAADIMGGTYDKTIEGTKQAIELLKKYQSTLDATDTDAINAVTESIKKMSAELDDANRKNAKKVLANPMGFSPAEIDEAIKMAEKMQNEATGPNAKKQWNDLAVQIDNARKVRDEYVSGGKFEVMNKQFQDFDNLSKSAAAEQKKYWEGLADSMAHTDPRYQTVLDNIKKIKDAEKAQLESKAADIMGGTYDKTIEGTKQAIELLKKYQSTLDATDTDGIEKVNDAIREMNQELDTAANKKARKALTTNLKTAGTEDIKQSVEWLKKYQGTLEPLTGEWYTINEEIKKGEERLKFLTDKVKMESMSNQFSKLKDLSINALAEQKKYWTEVKNTYKETDSQYQVAINNLQEIKNLEEKRIKSSATQTIADVKSGNWDKTIEENQQAIKLIEEYKKQLKTKTDADAIDEANKAIAELNANLGKAKEALMSVQDAIDIGAQIQKGTFDGTTEEVLRAKKALEEYRKTLKQKTDADKIKAVDEALRNVTNAAEQAKRKLVDIDDVLGRLDTASVEELEAAAKQLQEQLEGAAREGRNYGETAAKLREVNLELKKAKKEWEGQENVIARTAKRLMAYVAVYGGFNFIKDKITEAIHANLQLSDSFADIQKTTGLAAEEVKNLSRDIDAIDTRTSQQQLHELAATAGQIGLKSKEDVLGFVKASNMITVSLNELGSEGTASLMKIAQLTGEVTKDGVEGSLMAIGSAINELSANSAATAGPIVEFIKRMGGIAAQSGITSAEMAAIGATADAIGQSMEVTGTSMNKFVATLTSNSDQVAYALNMDAKALNELLEGGKTMDAMLMVFERMNEMGGIEKLAPVMGDLGSEGARMTQMLSAMAKSVGFLRDQVDLSREAFKEAISIENEYNIKNENAIALLERMGNTLREMWVNSVFVTGLTGILKQLNDFVKWLSEGEAGARVLKTIMIALGVSISLASMHLDKFCIALFKAKTYTDLFSGAWGKLNKTMKANWISLLIGALVSLGYYLYETFTHVSKLTRATQEYHSELDKENNIMRNLFKGAQNENLAKEKRVKLINEINSRYSKYLGFMVSERDSVNELAAAYELANAKMRESMATRMSNKQLEILDETYGERMAENRTDLMTHLSKLVQSAGREKEIMSVIRKVTIENLDKEEEDIRALIAGRLKEIGVASALADMGEVKDYIELQKEYYEEYETINKEAAEHLQQAQKNTADANVKMMNEMFKQVQDLNSGAIKESTEGPFKTALDIQRGIVQEGKQYIAFAEEQMKNMTEEQKVEVQKNIKLVETQIEAARKNLPEGDPWGKELNLKGWKDVLDNLDNIENLDTAGLDSLVSTYKELRDASKLITDVNKYNRMFGTEFTNLSQVMQDTHDKAEQIKNKLASYGRTTTGDFLWGKGGDRDQKAKARQDFQAAMSALEAFYKEYEDFVRQKRAEGLVTEEAMNRQLLDNTRKYNEDKQQLIKKFLGEENTFNQKQYKGILSGYDYFSDKDLDKMAEQYQRWGDAMTDGGRNQIAKAGVEISKAVNKEQEKIKAELLKGDLFATFENNFAGMLDELGALTSAKEDEINNTLNDLARKSGSEKIWGLSDEERKQRIAVLTKFADQSYQMNADRLKSEMLLETNNAMWVQRMNDEEMQLLLEKLRNYYDDRLGITKKYQDQLAKEFESYYKQSGKQADYEADKQEIDKRKDRRDQLEGYGVTRGIDYEGKRKDIADEYQNESDVLADKASFLNERLNTLQKGSAEYLATQKLITDTELAQNQLLADSQKALTQVYMDEWTKRAERWGQWGEMFGEYLGEQVMLEKQANDARARGDLETAKKIEQQQKQNKQALIQNLLSKIVDEAALWAKEYALKMMFNSLMLAEDKRKAIEEATLQGKSSMLSILLNALTGQSKEHAKGLPGLVTGAIIFAATMALQAFAKSAIANMFPEAATESTGTRKLSTGMLTYAEGNYPVLGNDGKVYDAKYEGAGMKTGVYGGGAHFGIFSEKQPEMIVDGKTTQKIILNYPYIYDAITTIAKNGRLKNAMPTFATGDYPAGMKQLAPIAEVDASAGSNEQMERMSAALEQNSAAFNQLSKLLQNGITAHLDGLETHKQQKKNERFLKRRGID